MKIERKNISDTEVELQVVADVAELEPVKTHVLGHFAKDVKVPGFRAGKVPPHLVEKNVDQAALQSEFLEHAVEELYVRAVNQEKLRVIAQPEISLTKFVPYTTLEFTAKVQVIGKITLPDYKTKFKRKMPDLKVTKEDVDEVIGRLKKQLAEKTDVDRKSKLGDQVWIDFKGVDDKGKAINGADGKDYPLALGSKTFIPGFEENLVGLGAGDEKTFDLTFPKDYGVKALANKKVTFTATVTKVQEVTEPKVDDEFAGKAGPFKSLKELRADIEKQVGHERRHELERNFESELVADIAGKSKLTVPEALIDQQVAQMMQELNQNLMYRGQTIQEFLAGEDTTEESYKKNVLAPQAADRVKAGLVLAEIAEEEKLSVSPEELEIRLQVLKGQYKDTAMQAELDKPENRKDIEARLLTDKTVNKLVGYAKES